MLTQQQATIFITLFTVLLLGACSSTSKDKREVKQCLPTTTGQCLSFAKPDIDGDGLADGLDFNKDGMAELFFLPDEESGARGLDIDGDSTSDYFLSISNWAYHLHGTPNDRDINFKVVISDTGQILGIDTNSDDLADDSRLAELLNDQQLPESQTNASPGVFSESQQVTISCLDNKLCGSIAYTLDGSEPDFLGNGTVVKGNTATLSLTSTNEEQQYLKFRSRDRGGNIEPVQTISYTIGCSSSPVAQAGVTQFVAKSSPFTLADAGSTTSANTIISQQWQQLNTAWQTDITAGTDLSTSSVNLTAPDEVTSLRFQLEITDDNNCKATDEVTIVVMEDPSRALFVDGDIGNDLNDGSANNPLATIRQAAINATNGEDIYVSRRNSNLPYDEWTTTLEIPVNVSLYGGYEKDWSLASREAKTTILGASKAIQFSQIGIEPVWLQRFDIMTVSPTNPIEPGYGVKLTGIDINAEANLINNRIYGLDAETNITSNAAVGYYGVHASNLKRIVMTDNEIRSATPVGGKAGVIPTAVTTPAANGKTTTGTSGGAGGTGSTYVQTGTSGGNGGGHSWYSSGEDAANKECYGVILKGGRSAGKGTTGTPGRTGPTGDHAQTSGLGIGEISTDGFFVPSAGSPGGVGQPGCGGTGGGGGSIEVIIFPVRGGGGGGAGAGGDGGTGGNPGTGGGVSAAVMLYQIEQATLQNNRLIASTGGVGGKGSVGALGQPGGEGAKGNKDAEGYSGGDGADGGRGGQGGSASGGGGGASIGLVMNTVTTASLTGNTISSSQGGLGGEGGSPGLTGEQGYSYAIYGKNLDTSIVLLQSNILSYYPEPAASGLVNEGFIVTP